MGYLIGDDYDNDWNGFGTGEHYAPVSERLDGYDNWKAKEPDDYYPKYWSSREALTKHLESTRMMRLRISAGGDSPEKIRAWLEDRIKTEPYETELMKLARTLL